MKNEVEFFKRMTVLGELYGKEISKGLMDLYWESLQDLTDEQFEKACQIISRSNKYNSLPKPAEFLEAINGTSSDQKSKDEILATQALLKLEEAIQKHGYYDSVQFDDPRIHKAIEHLGGWMKISTITMDEWTWIKKDFEKIYKSLLNRPYDESYPNRVVGFLEQDNLNRGTMDRLLEHLKPGTKYIGGKKVLEIKQLKGEVA